ncbi:MAG: ATP-binding protein [Calditrichaeota bacterium]|nr:ATP-binding protein [Calditrichota bacterium]
MITRPFWIEKIQRAWKKRSIVWLSGVRRVGKTTLTQMFKDAVYLNCDLPSVVRRLVDPEMFYDSFAPQTIIVFDEVHRIEDPSRLLKIAADAYPHLKILATGSSTLAATKKFRDSLTGRKYQIHLTPVLWSECTDIFKIANLDRRLLHGGLPEALLSEENEVSFFSEWIDSFYARDIQELFRVRNRVGFIKLLHLLLRQSGGLVDFSHLAKLSDMSRPTVKAHIEAMSIAHAIFLLPPFHGGGRREITQRSKCYGFDTGFVAFVKGWESIREDDRGLLWEHLVLDTLRTFSESKIYYWRDKSGREIDFVIRSAGSKVHTLECKINPDYFDAKSLYAFRALYPEGENFVICPGIKEPFEKRFDKGIIHYCSLNNFPYTIL